MLIEKPTFPLTINAFADALRTGHGRAMQQVENYGLNGLEGSIVAACVSFSSYDPQCEAERAPWLTAIVERAKLSAEVLRAIEASAQALSSENHWDMKQRSAILKELASAGSNEGENACWYSSLARSSNTSDVVGAEQIVALDGMEGSEHCGPRNSGVGCKLIPISGSMTGSSLNLMNPRGSRADLRCWNARPRLITISRATLRACTRLARAGCRIKPPRHDGHTGAEIVA